MRNAGQAIRLSSMPDHAKPQSLIEGERRGVEDMGFGGDVDEVETHEPVVEGKTRGLSAESSPSRFVIAQSDSERSGPVTEIDIGQLRESDGLIVLEIPNDEQHP